MHKRTFLNCSTSLHVIQAHSSLSSLFVNFLSQHPEGCWVFINSEYQLLQCQEERIELKKKHENCKFVGVLNERFVITKIQLLWWG